jgi:hypothetical protein
LAFVFALWGDGTDFLCMTKKLVGFVQQHGEKQGNLAWKQIVDKEYGAIDAKKEADDVDSRHR